MTELIKRLREWGDLPAHVRFLQSTESIFDQGNRHKSGAKPADYMLSWLSMLRPFAFATKDESWGEMEKLLCIVMRNYINVRKDAHEAADRLTAMKAAGDGVAGFAGHKDDCHEVLAAWGEVEACSCGYTEAWKQWKEASDGL